MRIKDVELFILRLKMWLWVKAVMVSIGTFTYLIYFQPEGFTVLALINTILFAYAMSQVDAYRGDIKDHKVWWSDRWDEKNSWKDK